MSIILSQRLYESVLKCFSLALIIFELFFYYFKVKCVDQGMNHYTN